MKHSFKTAASFLLAVLLLVSLAVPAFAGDSSVTYEGNAGKFIFAPGGEESPTDLFVNFKNVMPGDKLTQKIVIKNDGSKKVNAKIYMRALGAEKGSEKFLSQLKLTVKYVSDMTLFEAPADQTSKLTEWKSLGTYQPGAEATLEVTLEVPIELGNEFQNAIGKLDWQFKVEEIDTPKTGDDTVLWPYALVLGVCVALIVTVLVIKKRKEQEN